MSWKPAQKGPDKGKSVTALGFPICRSCFGQWYRELHIGVDLSSELSITGQAVAGSAGSASTGATASASSAKPAAPRGGTAKHIVIADLHKATEQVIVSPRGSHQHCAAPRLPHAKGEMIKKCWWCDGLT